MKATATGILLSACLVLAACRAPGPPGAPPAAEPAAALPAGHRPAVVVNPTPESRAELERVIGDMLFGADVTLSDDAFTQSSLLVLERARIRRLGQPQLPGRDLGMPERFRLLTTGTECVLVHETNNARYELPATECAPEP
ncbi:MAG TPA: hypothetical protein VKZ85_13235 [Woeseiaceae bacterium]|nr:hypothetical protein [Woeseiaceae bacterium]